MHKVFISYHHKNDQPYKEYLVNMGIRYGLFIDRSVDTGDIPENWDAQKIRQKIRDSYLRDSSVTILLCGEKTRYRKHIDWELASSMIDGQKNKKSGILVIALPSIACRGHVAHAGEMQAIYPEISHPTPLGSRSDYEAWYPDLPKRIIDSIVNTRAQISVCPWNRIEGYPGNLKLLIDATYRSRLTNEYDLSEPRRKHDRNPAT